MRAAMATSFHHLFEQPQLRTAAAGLIHHEFWTEVEGASVERMATRLAQATDADRIPLCLVAVHDGALVGVVNLVEDDDSPEPDWIPWLAGMVVAPEWRGRGVGSQLVRRLLDEARRLGIGRVWFGTDGPGFYTRLGAVEHRHVRGDFRYMRFDLA